MNAHLTNFQIELDKQLDKCTIHSQTLEKAFQKSHSSGDKFADIVHQTISQSPQYQFNAEPEMNLVTLEAAVKAKSLPLGQLLQLIESLESKNTQLSPKDKKAVAQLKKNIKGKIDAKADKLKTQSNIAIEIDENGQIENVEGGNLFNELANQANQGSQDGAKNQNKPQEQMQQSSVQASSNPLDNLLNYSQSCKMRGFNEQQLQNKAVKNKTPKKRENKGKEKSNAKAIRESKSQEYVELNKEVKGKVENAGGSTNDEEDINNNDRGDNSVSFDGN